MNIIKKLCGCRDCFTCSGRWGKFDFNKPSHALRYRACMWVEWIQDRPRVWRMTLADKLSDWALRLRGDKTYELGWGWGGTGNRAAKIAENLQTKLIPEPAGLEGETEDMLDQIDELAALAHATRKQQ